MPESSQAGPSTGPTAPSQQQQRPSSTTMSRRRSSSTRSGRSRPIRPRATSSISQRSDASNLSSGLQQLSWTTGDCFDYVDDDARISAFLHCPICLGPFLDPYASSLCSHTFCKHCITTALSDSLSVDGEDDPLVAAANKRCPTCRTRVELSDFQPTALLIKNMVDTLRVRCPNAFKGCEYECERHLLRGHVSSDCAYEYVDQNLNEGKRCGCSAKVMRKDWASHGIVCPKRKVSCPTCDAIMCADEMDGHAETCSPEPASCEYCGLDTIKSRLSGHVADECEDAPVMCPHAGFGCDWIGPRRRLQRSEDAAGKSTHRTHLEDECRFEPLKGFFHIFTQHLSQLKDENLALKTRVEDLETRQQGQARRIDDCVHSLGSWYRSAGELRGSNLDQARARGSQVGVDGEWDEFPLDAQNWERSLSQQSFVRQSRAQSAGAAVGGGVDLASWARRQYGELEGGRGSHQQRFANPAAAVGSVEDAVGSLQRYLAPPAAARSMPTSTMMSSLGGHSPSPSRERPSYLDTIPTTRRSGSTSTHTPLEHPTLPSAISPGSNLYPASHTPTTEDHLLDRTHLDSALSSLTSTLAGLSSGLSSLDKRTEEGHIAAVKAGFDAGRVQEEVASLRHGLHAVRMQIHQLLMQQQRYALFNTSPSGILAGREGEAGPSQVVGAAQANMPLLSPPLLRRWAGLEHTKL
ncbi:uncharacterized protein UTRI_10521_B [Ustilago trichophora]|uniref:RING-type domain-containing protein n=1 Tax=Ustilago trichophora TaxID=86804 RepID=A0A5C3E924_9BASI|nr:uncharacterized protein UTRI_10521_B [Ustilago trichophora]